MLVQIVGDMEGPAPMMRLLQGDVGSGKTAVAMLALMAAAGSGWQGALMAPTEVPSFPSPPPLPPSLCFLAYTVLLRYCLWYLPPLC